LLLCCSRSRVQSSQKKNAKKIFEVQPEMAICNSSRRSSHRVSISKLQIGCAMIVRMVLFCTPHVTYSVEVCVPQSGETALMCASHSGHLPVVELLIGQPLKAKAKLTADRYILSYGGDVKAAKLDARNSDGWSALMLAGNSEHGKEIVSALIGAGADVGVSCDWCGKAIQAHDGVMADDGKTFIEGWYTDISGSSDYHQECFTNLTPTEKAGLHKTTMLEKRKMAESRWRLTAKSAPEKM